MSQAKKRTREQVGELFRARRESLGLSQDEVPNLSSTTVRKIENVSAPSFKPRTLRQLAVGIGWKADAYEQLLAGADPIEMVADEPVRPSSRDDLAASLDIIEAELRRLRAQMEGR